ncbi:16S rRNA (adenine(1518)-N(6)/adenine(1519)-N(6))-dimethyltransferase RsmA [Deferrisoma camini]|uniref:16S rRNA (adenine(1518)-N(6)/adenine(1519)-N(6))- dimethyltransferase RsmA n=1 Tax=Deferrisoma camini TaxID=1035120 RepID=UPI00046D20B3|nr:16S rRNA (adenine(1518)-N(6)/adenine(1519)-N(6))-dimethyltransferase RsmA [Deferrisoma camini]
MRATPPVPPAKKSLGQHFLHDQGIIRRIAEAAGAAPGERMLEIGPGPGGLTRALLDDGARVWAVEADGRMVARLRALGWQGLEVIEADALAVDYPTLAEGAGGPLRLVGNLPYNISGPLLAKLLRERRAFPSITVMIQREVAERILARPGTRARGGLSVLAQTFCRIRSVLRVGPGAFTPPPRVESQVIRLDVLPAPIAPLDDEEALWRVVRAGFGRRRKMLRNALAGVVPDPVACLEAAGLTGRERAEALDAETWVRLANAVTMSLAAK